jgi:hypothetical protein
MQYERAAYEAQGTPDFAKCGVIDWEGQMTHGGFGQIVIAQLWNFRDLDPRGSWLDNASIELRPGDEDNFEVLAISDGYVARIPPISRTRFGEALRERGWAHVLRFPATPDFQLGLPAFTRANGARYELVGPADEHVMPFVWKG